jgi:hypothetical protein
MNSNREDTLWAVREAFVNLLELVDATGADEMSGEQSYSPKTGQVP